MTSVADPQHLSWSVTTAVLCGVEALSAQWWAVGAISLCAVFFGAGRRVGQVASMDLRSRCAASREVKDEGW